MGAFLNQIFSVLTQSPGSLIYHLILVFSIAGALQAAFVHWRSSEFPQARRTMFGLGMLLIAQIGLFLVSGVGIGGLINLRLFLPPLDRAVTLFSLVWMIWLWAFPEPSRPADAATWLLSLLVIAALALSLVAYSTEAPVSSYNQTIYDGYWQLASIGFSLLGLFILGVRRPNGWGYGIAVFLLSFAGHLLYLMIGRVEGDFPGAVRLVHMAAYPILLTLPQRFPSPSNRLTTVKQQDAPVGERRKYSTDPKTFHALLALAGESATDKLSQAITRAIAQTMLADLCFLIYLTDNNNQMQIASGYDLIREEGLEGGSLNKTIIPMLTNALQRGRPLRLPSSSTSADIKGLSDLLGLTNPGHLMSVPIVSPEKEPLGGVLLLSPYSNRLWSAEDQAFLANIAISLVPIIQRGQKMNSLEIKGEQAKQALDVAQARVADLERRNNDLLKQMETVKADAQEGLAQADNLTALRAMQEETQKALEKLKQENEDLRASANVKEAKKTGTFASSIQIENELRLTLEQVAHLQNQLAEANMRIIEAEKGSSVTRSTEQSEVVASISQELRQPMSSIVGYTDLLLGESVGILGTLQRKFVERIKASTERIGSLIDDLIQVTTLETGLHDLKPEPVDLDLIIDNAMSYTSSQIREKNISLHLDLPKNVGPIYADREALQQILIHLLQNAGTVSPLEGTVHLKVQTKTEDGKEYVLIQVSDTGGGIPAEDLGRVFTRLYRADNVLIQGVGDTGVGLSIAKTLTEAQKGRIWVDSELGVGSTFSVLLPIAKNSFKNTED
ncbi:MAG TPA: ATP-binding protein [Anaerolineales bacterium]|nr:ATP-binding protein [Anaerolineales bacterium]